MQRAIWTALISTIRNLSLYYYTFMEYFFYFEIHLPSDTPSLHIYFCYIARVGTKKLLHCRSNLKKVERAKACWVRNLVIIYLFDGQIILEEWSACTGNHNKSIFFPDVCISKKIYISYILMWAMPCHLEWRKKCHKTKFWTIFQCAVFKYLYVDFYLDVCISISLNFRKALQLQYFMLFTKTSKIQRLALFKSAIPCILRCLSKGL